MKTLMCVIMGILTTVALITVVVWVGTFLENVEIHWTNPIDRVADHAEKMAKIFNEIRRGE